jgi:hypothetical protein
LPDGEYEVKNRHGDVVQRGEIEIARVHESDSGVALELRFVDPVHLRRGGKNRDEMHGYVDLGGLER